MSRWAQLAKPPARITKGFDQALATALQTTTTVLFLSWYVHSPEALERTIPGTNFFRGRDVGKVLLHADEKHLSGEHFDQFLHDLSWGLTQSEADEMVAYVVKVVLAKHDSRYDAFKLIAEKLGLFKDAEDAKMPTRRDLKAAVAARKKG